MSFPFSVNNHPPLTLTNIPFLARVPNRVATMGRKTPNSLQTSRVVLPSATNNAAASAVPMTPDNSRSFWAIAKRFKTGNASTGSFQFIENPFRCFLWCCARCANSQSGCCFSGFSAGFSDAVLHIQGHRFANPIFCVRAKLP